ncbi:MAG: 4-(cytidine 5'-diphospho)-2-C-methyl-D-erythritol kinase [Chloroflexota bacterium]
MKAIRVATYAKVNLSLEVLGKRPDGFHEVSTVMQSISLADDLEMERADSLSLICRPPSLEGEDNLVLRAARALRQLHEDAPGARILLEKGIPVAGGLGGASCDAAAALVGLARLWGLEPPAERLRELAARLGSDVPFFLSGGTALAGGRGERIDPLPDAAPRSLVLLVPSHSLAAKTAELYRRLTPDSWSDGERTARLARAIADGNPLEDGLLGNSFEGVADGVFPGLADLRRAMLEAGAPAVHLSGSGPALFALLPDDAAAGEVARRLRSSGHRPLLARTLAAEEARPRPVVF